jgi:sugar phosphate isomerase/epimerase
MDEKNTNAISPASDRALSRRALLGGGVAAMTALSLPLSASADHGDGDHHHNKDAARRKTGIQLYTVRQSMEQDVAETLKAIAAIGYDEVEFAGYYDVPPTELRKMLNDLGMTAPSSHIDARTLRDDPKKLLDAAAALGSKYITIGWLMEEDRVSIDNYKKWATALNRAGELGKQYGVRAAYHNHDFEFKPIGGKVPYDTLLAETDKDLVDFELDMFWARQAGHDVIKVLDQAPDRFTMAHIKDMGEDGEMVDVGTGKMDFAKILSTPVGARLKYLFVEHDTPADPFRSAIISHAGLAKILAA